MSKFLGGRRAQIEYDRVRGFTGAQIEYGSSGVPGLFRACSRPSGLIPGLFQAFRAYSGLIPGFPGLSRASSRASGLIPRAAAIPSLSFLSGESHVFFFVNEVFFGILVLWSFGSLGSF